MKNLYASDLTVAPQNNLAIGAQGYAGTNNFIESLREAITQNPAAIIRDIGLMSGFNLGGVAGTNPIAMYQYLSDIGYGASVYWGNDIGNLDSMIRDAEVSILLYQGGVTYIHYVMVRVLDNGGFAIYNLEWDDDEHEVMASINDWISSSNIVRTPLALITVQ